MATAHTVQDGTNFKWQTRVTLGSWCSALRHGFILFDRSRPERDGNPLQILHHGCASAVNQGRCGPTLARDTKLPGARRERVTERCVSRDTLERPSADHQGITRRGKLAASERQTQSITARLLSARARAPLITRDRRPVRPGGGGKEGGRAGSERQFPHIWHTCALPRSSVSANDLTGDDLQRKMAPR
ncbi:hypothetical protein AAFF_G00423410 [Aldrovandia affinis]|uniref:Uncharacterized protein n=1 Tax=Aldrovandia affinis TaxID=143900 RepID=A0AAD7WZE2_9TELE|nr:hypothetical protein AAFF_G00423410 [Aldrovandia affinis]